MSKVVEIKFRVGQPVSRVVRYNRPEGSIIGTRDAWVRKVTSSGYVILDIEAHREKYHGHDGRLFVPKAFGMPQYDIRITPRGLSKGQPVLPPESRDGD